MSACVGTYSRRCSPAGPMPLKCSEPKLIEDADRVWLGLPDLSRATWAIRPIQVRSRGC
jgi:hypothetical protein